VLQGQTGILIEGEPFSAAYGEAFVGAVVELLKDSGKRQALGQAARERILTEYTWQQRAWNGTNS
jgi:glycosyltransferase involved in cell wall biosynthesis